MRKTVLSFLGAVLISLPALAQTNVKLNASASPSSGQAGMTSVSVTGSGFPSGTISPSAVTVTLTPSGGSPATTTATSVATVIGSTKIVGFLIPASISISAPTVYAVTISGQTTTGTKFQSSNSSSLTVNPNPSISSVSPTSGKQGLTVSVTITGQYTSFAIGATQANFGAGISVGGAAAGTNGPVTVTNATTAVANITLSSTAAAGPRNVIVVTGSQTASLANAFTVLVGYNPPTAVPGGPYSVQLPAAVQFNGSASSDPQSSALTFDWKFGDGTPDGSGSKPSHTYAMAGTYNGTLTVTDALGLSSPATGFAVTVNAAGPPPQVSITTPQPLTVFNAAGNPITVTGTIDKSSDTVSVNGTAATVSGGSFSASGILLREGQNILTVTATDTAGNLGTASETVTLNTTPPQLGILAPTNGAVLTSSTTTVAGNVNEQVPGTINATQVTVMVNGIAAAVSNRTFSAPNVPLVQGMNTITVVATDPAGNTSQAQINVTYMGSIPMQKIIKISGENQTGPVDTTLPEPLVIEVVDSNGAPVPNQQVTFTVAKSDGALTSTNQQGQTVTAVTDQNGQASVQFMLGSRVGVGNNQVSVTAPGFVGQALFCETSTVGSPAKILVEMGDAQTGLAGQALASPLVVEVFDAGGNPVAYVPVTYSVQQGGGNFNGNATLQVSTDINGMASALLTLGQQEGTSNNVVSATFSGNAGPAASFVASGQTAGPASITSITGLVEDDSNTAVPGATVTLEGTNYSAVSDVNGNFSISPAPVGTFLLQVNGHTSTRTDATFPTLVYSITTIAGLNNTLGMPVCLPPLDPTSVQTYDPTSNQPITLLMTGVPGYQLTVYPHSVTNPDGTIYSGPLSLSQVHADRVPMAPPHGSLPLIAGTLQPPGLHFNPPVSAQFPNSSALAPGTVVDIYSYDHDQMEWISQGPARVSADGSVIVSDPGFGISKSGWHFPPPPPPPPKCASSCSTSNPCATASCVNGACVTQPANDGADCDDGSSSGSQCGTDGKCKGGACTFDSSASDGQSCTPDDKCMVNAMCKSGQCVGMPYDTSSETPDPEIKAEVGFPNELVEAIDEALSEATNGNLSLEASVEPEGSSKNCCTQESGPIDNGDKEGSATGKLTLGIQGFPIGPAIPPFYKLVSIPFTTAKASLQITLGAFFGADISLEGQVGLRQNQCDTDDNCAFGSVVISFDPKVYVKGEVLACTSIYQTKNECLGGEVSGGIQVTFTGGVQYNKPSCSSGLSGTMSVSPPTIYGEAKVSYLGFSGQVGFEFPLTGIWPAYACSFPGGCAAQ